MFRLFFLISICFLSCGQDKNRKQSTVTDVVLENIDSVPNSKPDSDTLPDKKSVFHWRKWEKPNPRSVYLSDDILKHVAKGHVQIDGAYSDINGNGIFDLIIITGLANEDSLRLSGKRLPRHLLVFLDQKDFTFQSTKAIPRINCCRAADPYAGFGGRDGEFIINENCISNKKVRSEYRFRYVSNINDWLLDTVVTESLTLQDENRMLDTMAKKDFGKLSLKTFDLGKFKSKHM
jgi:hypothetical protein